MMKKMITKIVLCTLFICIVSMTHNVNAASETVDTLINGIPWYDNNNNTIDAHGMSFIKDGNYYYMFGTQRENEMDKFDNIFRTIKCYRSTDLRNWEYRNDILTLNDLPDAENGGTGSRPSVIYNANTGKYVLYMKRKVSGKKYAAIATCDTVDGNYTFEKYLTPWGGEYADASLFQDDDGKGYIVYSECCNKGGHRGRSICMDELSDDYLSSVRGWRIGGRREAPVIFKDNGTYYLLTSGTSGWAANQMKYAKSTSLTSGWSSYKPIGNSKTYESQPCDILVVNGSDTTSYIYVGDRHNSKYLGDSTYVWLPIKFNEGNLSLDFYNNFSINASTGIWSENDTSIYIDNVKGGVDGRLNRISDTGDINCVATTLTVDDVCWKLEGTQKSHGFYIDNKAGAENGRLYINADKSIETGSTNCVNNNVKFKIYAADNGKYYINCVKGRLYFDSVTNSVLCGPNDMSGEDAQWTINYIQ